MKLDFEGSSGSHSLLKCQTHLYSPGCTTICVFDMSYARSSIELLD